MIRKTLLQSKAIQLFTSGASRFLLYGGSRSGKSFIIIYAMIIIACKFPGSRHLICRFKFNHVKNSIWLDTLRKVLKMCFPQLPVHWNNQDFFVKLPNGSEIWIGGLDDKDRSEKILGMEFLTIFVNEASQITYEAFTTLLTRLAQKCEGSKNMLFVDENPPSKKHWTYKVFIQKMEPENNKSVSNPQLYDSIRMNPEDNLANISDEYLELLNSLPERKKKRFLKGLFGDDNEGALWTEEMIAIGRIKERPPLKRIVVALDPAVTSKDTSDETGIIVAGIGFDDHLYVLEDSTDTYTPMEWAIEAVRLLDKWEADRIVGEVNNGGDLIETVIRTVRKNVPYSAVHATRDKLTRAEPCAALYEQSDVKPNQAHHVGEFAELELEMTSWEAKKGEKSPNRIDALVWGAYELNLIGRAEYNFGWNE